MQAPTTSGVVDAGPIPARAGIGLRGPHHGDVMDTLPPVGWLEVHAENYFGPGGGAVETLERLGDHYPVSVHGVGLSLGSTDPMDRVHLARLRQLIRRCEPALVSEHLAWCSVGGRHSNALLPLPYTEEALAHVVSRVQQVQEFLGRRLLVENISSYLEFDHGTMAEWEFLSELARRSGCGLLLDVNNVHVSACNHGFDAHAFIDAVPAESVGEIHLAGHAVNRFDDGEVLIDTHDRHVSPAVWALYHHALERIGRVPTLIEWDTDLPPLAVLVEEAARADAVAARTEESARERAA